jgi:hypothetical protein
MKTSIPPILITFALVCFALVQNTQAVSPVPDGGYPGGNTAEGQSALLSLTSGGFNTAVGFLSLRSNTFGNFNTATGAGALLANNSDENTATGAGALLSNFASQNTANGAFALFSNTTGIDNTASGGQALFTNTTGGWNTADGAFALFSNTAGSTNTANGYQAATGNTTGDSNTANGYQALFTNTTGHDNTAVGFQALFFNTTGSHNIALGQDAGSELSTGDNNIDIGNVGINGDSTTIRIGEESVQTTTFIAGIRGATTGTANAIPVLIDTAGQLGTVSSSRRFKKEIEPMDSTSEAILALKPVTFHYKSDNCNTPQFGLIAEEVAEVNPDLVVHDKNGDIYTVRYDAVNAMLLNEFLKEHKAFVEQRDKVKNLEATVASLATTVKEQAFQIQMVSAQLEASKPAPQVVNNP